MHREAAREQEMAVPPEALRISRLQHPELWAPLPSLAPLLPLSHLLGLVRSEESKCNLSSGHLCSRFSGKEVAFTDIGA